MSTEHQQVGTIEILRTRIYALDPETADHPLSTDVVVEAGTYSVFRDFEATYWLMTGRINGRTRKIGDGLLMASRSDEATGPLVTFPSKRFGPDALAELLTEPAFTEGHPEQRCRLRINAPLPA